MESEQERDQLKAQVAALMLQRDTCSSEAEKAEQQVVIWKAHHADVVESRRRGDLIKHQLLETEKVKVDVLERRLDQARALLILMWQEYIGCHIVCEIDQPVTDYLGTITDADLAWAKAQVKKPAS